MLFSRSAFVALLSAPLLALAQSTANPPNVPNGFNVTAGQPVDLSWTPTTSGTVSLLLRSGASNNLDAGVTFAANITNSGSYTWTPASDITRGSDYTIEIVDDADSSQTNYWPYFVINSDNTVASTTNPSSSTATASSTSGSSSGSSSTSGSSATAVSTTSSSGSSSSGSSTSTSGSSTGSASSTSASTSNSAAAAASSAATVVGSSSSNGGAKATGAAAIMGLIGVAALGAAL